MGFGLLKGRNRNLSGDGRKIIKKLIQGVTTFDVVDERLHGYPRANKYRRTAQDVGVRANDR